MEMDLESQIRHVHGSEEVIYALDELVVVCLVRDGRPYLKSFVEHYFSLDVKHIVFLDNGSSDGTVEALKSYQNVTILQTDLSFKEHQWPLRQYLVTRFGRGRWVLCVDIDELFDYPYSDVIRLSSFLRYLTEKSYTAVVAQMLDMFPERTTLRNAATEDEPLKELHRFYDISNITAQDYSRRYSNTLASEEIKVYWDGIRNTIFKNSAHLTKHPLMFLDDQLRPIDPTVHWVRRARVADITCVLFHYKFIGDFYERTVRAVEEENYTNNSVKYKKFLETLERDPKLQFKLETAQELKDVNDLVDNGYLVVSAEYMVLVDEEEKKGLSAAGALGDGGPRRRLVEAFSNASARARRQAIKLRDLRLQVKMLEESLTKEHRRTENSLAKERRRVELLEKRNRNLERQIQEIKGSRSWKLLDKLGRIRGRMLGK